MEIADISFYQYKYNTDWSISQLVDFRKMATKSKGVIIRAGQGSWKDIAFDISWRNAKAAGLLRGSYWFYDSRVNPKRQAELWASILGTDAGELELWMDFEDKYNGPYHGHKHWYDFAERLKALLPDKQIGVYTGYYYWKENTKPTDTYFAQYPLWIAWYGGVPKIPAIWNEWFMHQFTDNGDGADWGVASGNIDINTRKGELETSPSANQVIMSFGQIQATYEEK